MQKTVQVDRALLTRLIRLLEHGSESQMLEALEHIEVLKRNLAEDQPDLRASFREANGVLCALLDKYPDELDSAMCERIERFGVVLVRVDA